MSGLSMAQRPFAALHSLDRDAFQEYAVVRRLEKRARQEWVGHILNGKERAYAVVRRLEKRARQKLVGHNHKCVCGTLLLVLLAWAGDVEPNPGSMISEQQIAALKLYHEPQEELYCLVHAYNAFVGEHKVDGEDLLDYCLLFTNACPNGTYMHNTVFSNTEGMRGNFCQGMLDHWLYHGCHVNACFRRVASITRHMHWKAKLETLDDTGAEAYLLGWGDNYGDT
jgi:hypothetical protein